MRAGRATRVWELLGKSFTLAGPVGFISPWIPDDGEGLNAEQMTGWALVGWFAVCALLLAFGWLFSKRAEDGRWPCWLLGGHRRGELDRGWVICQRCHQALQHPAEAPQ